MKTSKPPPPPPKGVPPELQDAWAAYEYKRVTGLLGKSLKPQDHSLLIDYAQTYSDVIQLRADVKLQGHTLVSDKGNAYINPTTNLLISRESHLAALRRDLYFTPKSRVDKQKSTKQTALEALDHDDGE